MDALARQESLHLPQNLAWPLDLEKMRGVRDHGVGDALVAGEAFGQEGRRLLIPLAGAVLLVFLIACGNAAGLLLARGLQRHHEYGVRAALGAGPLDLCRPVLMESLLLACLGALAGAALAGGCVNTLKVIAGSAIPRLDAVRLGWPVWLFSLAAAAVAGLIAGLLPAWRSREAV